MEKEQKKERPKMRIHIFVGLAMIGLALIYDGIQALIELLSVGFLGWLLNPMIAFWSFLTFFTWFHLLGVSYARPGKLLVVGVAYLAEFIPFLNDIPSITLSVIILIAMTNAEDIVAKISPKAAAALSTILTGPNLKKLTGSAAKVGKEVAKEAAA